MIQALHIPDFQAWARWKEIGTPVIVARHGRVIAATAGLRDAGVRDGESVERIIRKHPGVRVAADDPAFERSARDMLEFTLNRFSPSLAVLHRDFFCLEPDSLHAAQSLVEMLGVRSGLAPTDRVACFAAIAGYAGVVEIVEEGEESAFLARQPVEGLPLLGIADETAERLALFGYRTVGRAMTLSKRHLTAQFGRDGKGVFELLHGEGRRRLPPWVPPPSVRVSQQWEDHIREPMEWREAVVRLSRALAERLGEARATLMRLELEHREPDSPWTRSKLLKEPTNDPAVIEGRIRWMLESFRYPPFDRMTVTLAGLVDPDYTQAQLFDDRSALRHARRNIIRRWPGTLLEYEEVDPLAPLPEERYVLSPARE